jgi:peptidoglycan/xylan/chitin deacetylase (PgdA/CDA1 family)
MEAAMRDWLFGCNPWGTSMICGLPAGGDYPLYPHSAVTVYLGQTTTGGLVDGPVYRGIYESRKGLTLTRPDSYAPFQNGNLVYHDDVGDYSTNEPTLDGTAGLSYYLSSLEEEGRHERLQSSYDLYDDHGALIRKGADEKVIYLVFSADEYGDGFDHLLDVLDEYGIKGSFFLTGNFLRNRKFSHSVKRIIAAGHYAGPHSDGHLLYIPWENRDTLLVTKEQFTDDLRNNYNALRKAGLKVRPGYFLAPYEWYNSAISRWSEDMGLTLVNFTPGTGTNADYTTPDMENYRPSDYLIQRLASFEENSPWGLKGALVLIHPGTAPERTDALWLRLGEIIDYYKEKGYTFNRL